MKLRYETALCLLAGAVCLIFGRLWLSAVFLGVPLGLLCRSFVRRHCGAQVCPECGGRGAVHHGSDGAGLQPPWGCCLTCGGEGYVVGARKRHHHERHERHERGKRDGKPV